MSSDVSPEKPTSCSLSSVIPAIGAIIVILVNAWIIWFFLISIPAGCAQLAADTGGRQTCGVEPGVYIIIGINVVLILVAVYYILKWNAKKAT